MENMFDECTSLEYLDISNFKTSQVTSQGYMFYNVESLKYINLHNAQINNNIKSVIEDKLKYYTIICQKYEIVSSKNNDCSIFYDSDNYIIVKYGNRTI